MNKGEPQNIILLKHCHHCNVETNEEFAIGVMIPQEKTLIPYCCYECLICSLLDLLADKIESSGIIDVSWKPIIKQIHDQLMIAGNKVPEHKEGSNEH